jgi:hypothetical protein
MTPVSSAGLHSYSRSHIIAGIVNGRADMKRKGELDG